MVSIFWTIVTIPLISIVGYAVKYLYQDYTSPLKKIPRIPNPSFFFGNAKEFMDAETGIIQRKWSRILPFGIFMSRFFMSYRVTITDPKALAKVLVTNCYDYPKPERTRLFLTMILGNGVLVAEGFEHKKQRRSLDSAFSLQRIKAIAPLFHAPSHKLAMKWVELIKKEGGKNGLDKDQVVMDVMSWLSRCTLDIIGSAGFDYEFDSLENPNNELAVAYNELFGEGLKPSLLFFALNTVVSAFPFLIPVAEKVNNRYKIIKKNRIIVERTAQRLLDQKREELKAAGNVIDEANLKKDILSVLVRDNLGHEDPLTDTEIKDQCLTFLAAGHETTATALTWSLLRLAENHAVQDRLREEVLQKFGDKLDEPIQFEELHSLPYLNAFTREVLRLDHPVPMTLRVAAKDDVLCGYQIPKGTNIVIPPATVHYHPDIWGPDAEVFDPTRFIEEGRIPDPAKGPYANLTFIAGPRNCIGTKFALAEMKAILVQLVARFRFDVAEVKHIERRTGLVMTPKGKLLNLKVSLAK